MKYTLNKKNVIPQDIYKPPVTFKHHPEKISLVFLHNPNGYYSEETDTE